MKRRLLVILLTMALVSSFFTVASAEEGGVFAVENFSSTIIFTTDYISNGISYSDQDPAIQGTIDYSHPDTGIFLGLWGSSYDDGGYSSDIELGVWGGQAGSVGPLDYDVSLNYWFYPGADDDGFEFDYFETVINVSHTFKDVLLSPTVAAGYHWSPDYSGEEGNFHKFVGKLNLSLVYGLSLGLEAAHMEIEGGAFTGNGNGMDGGDGYDWEYYRIGVSKDLIAGFNVDLSYYYNSEDDWFKEYYGGNDVADPRLVFTLSRTF